MRAIIIDDEAHCRNTLDQQLKWSCPEVKVLRHCANGLSGIEAIKELSPELIFLDIEMPNMTGFEMLEQLDTIDCNLIFTTAYDEYALKAFNTHAIAYLLKPICEDDLLIAIQKVADRNSAKFTKATILSLFEEMRSSHNTCKVAFPTNEGLEFVDWKNIIRCEADSNYTKIFLASGEKYLISKTLKEVSEIIDQSTIFMRPHASHLVNMNYIKRYLKGVGGQLVMEDGSIIPVSRGKKGDMMNKIG